MRSAAKHGSRLHRRWPFYGDYKLFFSVEITGESQGNLVSLSSRSGRTLCLGGDDSRLSQHTTIWVVLEIVMVDNPAYPKFFDCGQEPSIPPRLPRNVLYIDFAWPSPYDQSVQIEWDFGGKNVLEAGTYHLVFSRVGTVYWLEVYSDQEMTDLLSWEYINFGQARAYNYISICETSFGDWGTDKTWFRLAGLKLTEG